MLGLTDEAKHTDSGHGGRLDTRMRILLAGLVALGLTLAPIGAAWAAFAHASNVSAAMTDAMPDCPGMAAKPAQDCACCDTKAAPCQSDLCLAKCWKLVGEVAEQPLLAVPPALKFARAIASKPPDRNIAPIGPPPRS